jgi:hypothetical protein
MIGAGVAAAVASGLYSGLWLAFIGWFVYGAAGAELAEFGGARRSPRHPDPA